MLRSNYPIFTNAYEDTIARLRVELYQVRRVIIDLMPEEARKVLYSYSDCESREERRNWRYIAANRVLALAKPIPNESPFYFGERAYCPLCGGGSSSPLETGFALDEGLRRHLLGWSNIRMCQVLEATVELASEYWHHKFHDSDEAGENRKREQIAQRKKDEVLYRTAPDRKPDLFDETGYGEVPRDEDSLAWAEGRLTELGFQLAFEGNVKSYTDEREAFTIYADPRSQGEIKFSVYRKTLIKGEKTRTKYLRSFSLKDSWKRDLRSKYESRIAK